MKKFMKAVTFSYDDGVQSDRRLIELFNKYGAKCTFNLNSGLMSNTNMWCYKGFDVVHLDATENLCDLYKGHEIAVHGTRHISPLGITEEELEAEFFYDRKKLEEYFETDINGMAYAFGRYDDNAVEYLKKIGLKYGRTIEVTHDFEVQSDLLRFKPTCHHKDPELMNLCERFVKSSPDTPQIFYVWGH